MTEYVYVDVDVCVRMYLNSAWHAEKDTICVFANVGDNNDDNNNNLKVLFMLCEQQLPK